MPKVSIIIPVYKVEKYLYRCVESLRKQTLADIEIILVDDGSPDSSPAICDELAQKDSRIRVVHKKNGGLSSARNAGLAIAEGEYIGFVDSDDDVEFDMYEIMYQTAILEKVDFVMADYFRVLSDGERTLKSLSIRAGRYSKENLRREIYPALIMGGNLEYGPLLSVWHCLYKKSFLDQYALYFDEEVRWSEDNIFSAIMGYHANSFYYLKGKGLYHYYNNPGTITTSYRKGAWGVYSTMNRHLHDFFDNISDYDFSNQLKLHMIFYACNCLGQIKRAGINFSGQIKLIKEIMKSDMLKDAFNGFVFPKTWVIGMKVQIALIKSKNALLYRLLIIR